MVEINSITLHIFFRNQAPYTEPPMDPSSKHCHWAKEPIRVQSLERPWFSTQPFSSPYRQKTALSSPSSIIMGLLRAAVEHHRQVGQFYCIWEAHSEKRLLVIQIWPRPKLRIRGEKGAMPILFFPISNLKRFPYFPSLLSFIHPLTCSLIQLPGTRALLGTGNRMVNLAWDVHRLKTKWAGVASLSILLPLEDSL